MESIEKAVRRIVREEVALAWRRAVTERAKSTSAVPRKIYSVAMAAEYCGIATQTLYNIHSRGEGPKAFKQGRLTVYYPADLDIWLENRLVAVDSKVGISFPRNR